MPHLLPPLVPVLPCTQQGSRMWVELLLLPPAPRTVVRRTRQQGPRRGSPFQQLLLLVFPCSLFLGCPVSLFKPNRAPSFPILSTKLAPADTCGQASDRGFPVRAGKGEPSPALHCKCKVHLRAPLTPGSCFRAHVTGKQVSGRFGNFYTQKLRALLCRIFWQVVPFAFLVFVSYSSCVLRFYLQALLCSLA